VKGRGDLNYLGFTLSDIRARHEAGLISVRALDDLIIANYTAACTYGEAWDKVTLQCRGLVLRLDKPWPEGSQIAEVVALPMRKFFNWGEGGRVAAPGARLIEVAEKMDGSLGLLLRHNGAYRIATRGSFDSEQARWATRGIQKREMMALPENITLLFEIIYPGNRVVVDYGQRAELVLLAATNRRTGADLNPASVNLLARRLGFSRPCIYLGRNIDQLIEATQQLDLSMEGWVLRFSDGSRFKVKGQEYLRVHRLISGLSKKRVVEAMAEGRLDEWRIGIPEEFRAQVDDWYEEAEAELFAMEIAVDAWLIRAPTTGRKDIALWAQSECPEWVRPLLFNRLDRRDIRPALLKKLLKTCGKEPHEQDQHAHAAP
jgi:RNA ligase